MVFPCVHTHFMSIHISFPFCVPPPPFSFALWHSTALKFYLYNFNLNIFWYTSRIIEGYKFFFGKHDIFLHILFLKSGTTYSYSLNSMFGYKTYVYMDMRVNVWSIFLNIYIYLIKIFIYMFNIRIQWYTW